MAPRAWRRRARLRRWVFVLFVLAQTVLALHLLAGALPWQGRAALERGLMVLFALLFPWLSAGLWLALYGFFLRRRGGDPWSLCRRHPEAELAGVPLAPVAVVMPLYHESVLHSYTALRAVYRDLERLGQLEAFEFFILSDSRDPEVWLAEQQAWLELVRDLGAEGRLFYRRRRRNARYKSGNVADFLRRWGDRYRYMVVLDADSLMAGDTLVRMVRLMECEPQVGILQTSPTIVHARTALARIQQFSSQLCSPLFSTGLAALQLGEASYWGHNALVRTRAFMEHCGLRRLRGRGLFGGPVLSHDFVEAACMGRAGHEVWLEPGLGGSHEETPPSLAEELARDRRWARGNLQHLALVGAPGLRWAHRMVFLNGVMAYGSAPLWLAFLVLATVVAGQWVLVGPGYFPEAHSLHPSWPQWRPERGLALLGLTAVQLFLPRLLAAIDAQLTGRSADHGGGVRLWASTGLEIVFSALLAPLRMLAHTGFVLSALANANLQWAGQNRSAEAGWRGTLRSHAPGMVLAVVWLAVAWWLDPLLVGWALPVALPWLLGAPLSVWLGRNASGDWLRRRGLLWVRSEREDSPLLMDARNLGWARRYRLGSALQRALLAPACNRLHQAFATTALHGARAAHLLSLRQRFFHCGPRGLSREELSLLLMDRPSLAALHRRLWQRGEAFAEPD